MICVSDTWAIRTCSTPDNNTTVGLLKGSGVQRRAGGKGREGKDVGDGGVGGGVSHPDREERRMEQKNSL